MLTVHLDCAVDLPEDPVVDSVEKLEASQARFSNVLQSCDSNILAKGKRTQEDFDESLHDAQGNSQVMLKHLDTAAKRYKRELGLDTLPWL